MSMAHLRDSLARIFYPTKERLEAFIEVTKTGVKKKKSEYLVLTVTLEQPSTVSLWIVKGSDKAEWKCKPICNARHLREVNCFDYPNKPSYDLEFKQEGQKVTRVFAVRFEDKREFVGLLIRVLKVHLPSHSFSKVRFINIPEGLSVKDFGDQYLNGGTGADSSHAAEMEDQLGPDDFYQTLSSKDEADIQLFLDGKTDIMQNASEFMAQLRQNLISMEGTNIHSIMSSEEQVAKLMETLDAAILLVENMEKKVNTYEQHLVDVEDAMSHMTDRDKVMQLTLNNRQNLLNCLQQLNERLTLDNEHLRTLLELELKSNIDVDKCTQAAIKLDSLLRMELTAGLEHMHAVEEKSKYFREIRDTFAQKLNKHINDMFIRHENEFIMRLNQRGPNVREVCSSHHDAKHEELLHFKRLMLWLKQNKPRDFEKLINIYCDKMGAIYDREIHGFFESAKLYLVPPKDKRQAYLKASGSNSSLSKGKTLDSVSDLSNYSNSMSSAVANKFEVVFEEILFKLKPLLIREQEFCVSFFHMSEDLGASGVANNSAHNSSTASNEMELGHTTNKDDSQVRLCMENLFKGFGRDLLQFIDFCEKINPAYTMNMLVIMYRYFDDQTKQYTFLAQVWFQGIIAIKRAFDSFKTQMIQTFKDFKPNKKARCGLIAPVLSYEKFSESSMSVFQESSRVADMEKAHLTLVQSLIVEIERVAKEHGKTPQEVVCMENYHRLYDILSRLKLSSLDSLKKDIKKRYTQSLNDYVANYMGRPLEKLSLFFENVQYIINGGMKKEAVVYQSHTSKQELRKVIKEYPGKEVKRGLQELCRKVQKHLSEEENLFRVVWRSMQDEFLKQCAFFESLIQDCYPDSNITLEFTTRDIENYFLEIETAH